MIVTSHVTQHARELVDNGLATARLRRDGITILHNPVKGQVGTVRLGTESVWYRVLSVRERVALCQGLSDILGLLPPVQSRLDAEGGHVVDIRYDGALGWMATAREP